MLDGTLMGYLWASVDGNAASYRSREAAGAEAWNLGLTWIMRLRWSKRQGMTSLQAIRYWADRPENPEAGVVPPGTEETELASLAELRALADDGPPPLTQPERDALNRYWSRVKCCLLGGAYGDALGYPSDPKSQVSSATQMTLFTCEGLIAAAIADATGTSPRHLGRPADRVAPHVFWAYRRWLETQGSQSTTSAAQSWLSGQAWLREQRAPDAASLSGLASSPPGILRSPKNPEAKGAGAVRRAAPFGLQKRAKSPAVFEEAVNAAVLTHGHPSGYLPAGAFAVIIRCLLDGASLDEGIDDALFYLDVEPGNEATSAALASARKAAEYEAASPDIARSLGSGRSGDEALAIAVYSALSYPEPGQIAQALQFAVTQSGDPGSICGNIIGAWHAGDALADDLAAVVEGGAIIGQIADDFTAVNWPKWQRRVGSSIVADFQARYPDTEVGRALDDQSAPEDTSRAQAIKEPVDYPQETDSPVLYLPVVRSDVVVGYLWAAVTNDAASFVLREAAGYLTEFVEGSWRDRLRQSKAEGRTPVQALRYWATRFEDSICGAVPAGVGERQSSLADLKAMGRSGTWLMSPKELDAFQWHHDKVAGCLLGGAIGDALGYPIEFDRLDAIRAAHGERGITGFVTGQVTGFEPGRIGLVSDDTQMTLFTCEGLITAAITDNAGYSLKGQYREDKSWADPTAHIYRSYQRWLKTQYSSQPPRPAPSWLAGQAWLYSARAPGNACLSGLSREGIGTRAEPRNPGSKGCGTVMRAAPFGLHSGKLGDVVLEEAISASVLTHGHPSAYLAAGAFAVIVHRVFAFHRALSEAIDEALSFLQYFPDHQEVTNALNGAREAAASGPPSPEVVESLGGGWTAEEALAIAVYAALAYPEPDQIRDALLLAVNHSGDSDSTGAICGNILGAAYGRSALPADLLEAVEGRETIEEIAADLAMVTSPGWRRYTPPEHIDQTTARYPAE